MKLFGIKNQSELSRKLQSGTQTYLLLYKEKTGQEDCAYTNLSNADISEKSINFFAADVNKVRDIHTEYGIKSVPSLLYFDGDRFINSKKGCNTPDFYKALFEKSLFSAKAEKEGKPKLNITVYSTPSCTYCNQIKTYFKENKVPFRDIDVSKNQKAAEEMVKRSGQQGVPQTVINGKTIIGFDKPKIDQAAGLQ